MGIVEQQERQDQNKLKKALGNKEEREKQNEQLMARLNQVMKVNQGSSSNQPQSSSQGPNAGP